MLKYAKIIRSALKQHITKKVRQLVFAAYFSGLDLHSISSSYNGTFAT